MFGVVYDTADALNERIVERVNASGDAYLTHTRGRVCMRVCMRVGIGNVETTIEHLRHVWTRVGFEASESTRQALRSLRENFVGAQPCRVIVNVRGHNHLVHLRLPSRSGTWKRASPLWKKGPLKRGKRSE